MMPLEWEGSVRAKGQLMDLLPEFIPSVKGIVFQVGAGLRGGLQITAPDLWDTIMGLGACVVFLDVRVA